MANNTMNCDLLVIGAGGCGLVAGVKAAELSGKKVIIIEKAKKYGGSSIFAHGMAITDSKFQKKAGEKVSDTPSVSGQFFDWICEKGGVEKYFKIVPNEKIRMKEFGNLIMPERTEKYKNHPDHAIGPGWSGTVFTDKLVECCGKLNIPVLTETRAKEFMTDINGKVTGVLADTKDGTLLVNFKACLISAGGFGSNEELLSKLFPETFNNKSRHRYSPPACTGDWIEMAEKIGASVDVKKARITLGGPAHHPYSYSIYRLIQYPEIINVNLNGERWYNETGGLMTGAAALGKQPKGQCYAVVDSDILELVWKKALSEPNEESDLWIQKMMKEQLAYEVALDERKHRGNHTKKADTLKELAVKMDIDPKAFVATIEKYNKYCEKGKDPDFGKKDEYLKPILKPPFYAFWAQRFTEVSHGGIAVNEEGEVLDIKGNVMAGLYAGGDCTTIYSSSAENSGSSVAQGGPTGSQVGAPGGQEGFPGGEGGAPGGEGAGPGGQEGGFPGGGGGEGNGGMGGPNTKPGPFGSGRGQGGGGLGGAITFGYTTGINIAKYLNKV
jgi:fumarate reductase flavoprotein subunit